MIHKGTLNRSIPQLILPPLSPPLPQTSQQKHGMAFDPLSESSQYLGFNSNLLHKFKLQFNKLIIPDDYLSETDPISLKEVVNKLEKLSLDIKVAMEDFKSSSSLTDRSFKKDGGKLDGLKLAGRELVEEIFKEICLYKEFIKGGDSLTLESIMNEDESSETSSINYFSTLSPSLTALSPLSPLSQSGENLEFNFETHLNNLLKSSLESKVDTSMLSWVQLLPITQQLFSDKVKELAGFPTCITVSKYIIFGTSRGVIVIFDFKQQLKWILGNGAIALEHGSVSALSISSDGSWVVVGYNKGMLLVYRIDTGHLVATILPTVGNGKRYLTGSRSAHRKNSRITHISFVGSGKRFVSGDDNGIVCLHSVANQFTKVSGRCRKILDLSDSELADGEVTNPIVALEALRFGNTDHLADKVGLVAVLTFHQLTILRIRPKPEVLLTVRRDHLQSGVRAQLGPSDGHFFQHGVTATCQWFPCYFRDGQTYDPQLAIAWGNYLTILRISTVDVEVTSTLNFQQQRPQLELFKVDHYSQNSATVSLHWINDRNLLVVDKTEQIFVYDVHRLHSTTVISNLQEYRPSTFSLKRSSTGLYAQLNDDLLPIYSNGIQVYKGKLFVLGQNSVYIGMPLAWNDHLKVCLNQGDAYTAIGLTLEYLREGPKYYFSNLSTDLESRKRVVGPQLHDLVVASCRHLTETGTNDTDPTGRDTEVKSVVRKCVEASLELHDFNLLFDTVFPELMEHFPNPCYQTLLDYVVNPTPSSIDLIKYLPPTLLTATFQFFADSSLDGRRHIEPLLYNLDLTTLDLNFVVNLLNRLNLTDGIMYVWSTAFLDFLVPINTLLRAWDSDGISDSVTFRTKLFHYFTCCLEERTYPDRKPLGKIAASEAIRQLFHFVIASDLIHLDANTTLHLSNTTDAKPYPYLRFLLSTDPSQATLVLEKLRTAVTTYNKTSVSNLDFQEVVQVLLELVNSPTNLDTISNLYIYHLLVTQPSESTQTLDSALCQLMFESFLTDNADPSDLKLAEVRCSGLHALVRFYTPNDLYSRLESAEHYHLLRQLYHQNQDVYNELRCSFLEPTYRTDLFTTIATAYETSDPDVQVKVTDLLWANVYKLIILDPQATVNLMEAQFQSQHEKIIQHLKDQPHLEFQYLQVCLNDLRSLTQHSQPLLDRYIELLCRYEPTSVLSTLIQLDKLQLQYNKQVTLEYTRKLDVTDATVYLLEVDYPLQAVDELLQLLNLRIHPTLELFKKLNGTSNITNELIDKVHAGLIRVQATIDLAIKLGDRVHLRYRQHKPNTTTITDESPIATNYFNSEQLSNDCEMLYFKLLDATVHHLQLLLTELHRIETDAAATNSESTSTKLETLHKSVTDSFRNMIQNIFNAILHPTPQPYIKQKEDNLGLERRVVSIPKLLVKVLSNRNPNTASAAEGECRVSLHTSDPILGEFRDLLVGVLATCKAESNWLLLAAQLTTQDKFLLVEERYKHNSRGRRGFAPRCISCRKRLLSSKEKVVVFQCGHTAHINCVDNQEGGNLECTKCKK